MNLQEKKDKQLKKSQDKNDIFVKCSAISTFAKVRFKVEED
jgi:hypothetical protein